MTNNKVFIACGVLLSCSIIFSSVWLSRSITSSTVQPTVALPVQQQAIPAVTPKGLISEQEAAQYLSMTPEQFTRLLVYDNKERFAQGSYDTYKYIPFIEIDRTKYFNKEQINKWIEYNSMNRTVRP
jgi:hypothetical protein